MTIHLAIALSLICSMAGEHDYREAVRRAAADSAPKPVSVLTVTVREFRERSSLGGHPDFGVPAGNRVSAVAEMVRPELDGAGRPVLGWRTGLAASPQSFEQWFTTNLGVNVEQRMMLEVLRREDGRFEACSARQQHGLFSDLVSTVGRPGPFKRQRERLFTMEMRGTFRYQAGIAAPMLEVTASGDAWVFINGRLAIDLGGAHGLITGRVNLSTLQLGDGEHDIAIFFAQRHTAHTRLRIVSPFELVQSR